MAKVFIVPVSFDLPNGRTLGNFQTKLALEHTIGHLKQKVIEASADSPPLLNSILAYTTPNTQFLPDDRTLAQCGVEDGGVVHVSLVKIVVEENKDEDEEDPEANNEELTRLSWRPIYDYLTAADQNEYLLNECNPAKINLSSLQYVNNFAPPVENM